MMQQKEAPGRDPLPLDAGRLARLDDWLKDNVEGFRGPFTLEKFSGGQSNPTYRIMAASGAYVLRRKPYGTLLPSAHAVEREYRVMKALAGAAAPVPAMLGLCEDVAVIGVAFFVMAFVEGRVFWDPSLPGMPPGERAAIYDGLNRAMADLHAVEPAAVGLGDYARAGGYMARQVARWSSQYRASETQRIESMDRLIEWLPSHLPPEGETRIVHGDPRLDNFIFHPTQPRVLAILDWELSTLGDPNADFAYQVMAWRLGGDLFRGLADVDIAALGIPPERDYVAAYFARVGRPVPAGWDVYIVFNMFRLAAILQGVGKRALDGNAADARAAEMGAKARPIGDLAWVLARSLD